MIPLLMMFILGSGVGGCAVVINDRIVDLRTEELERENRKLREKIHRDRVEYEKGRAYRQGYYNALHRKDNGETKKG